MKEEEEDVLFRCWFHRKDQAARCCARGRSEGVREGKDIQPSVQKGISILWFFALVIGVPLALILLLSLLDRRHKRRIGSDDGGQLDGLKEQVHARLPVLCRLQTALPPSS